MKILFWWFDLSNQNKNKELIVQICDELNSREI